MSTTVYDDLVLRDRPVLYLPLDDGAGTTATALAGSNGTYNGSPTLGVAGPDPVGSTGISTDGSNDNVSTPSVALAGAAQTLEVWADAGQVTSASTRKYLIAGTSINNLVNLGPQAGAISNEVVTIFSNDTGDAYDYWTGLTIPDGWHHWVFVNDGTRTGWTFYLDGEDVTGSKWGATKSTHNGGAGPWATQSLHLAEYGAFSLYAAFDGLAAFAVYDYELTATQIAQHYTASAGSRMRPLGRRRLR